MGTSPHFIAPFIELQEYACSCCGQLPFDFNEEHPSEPFRELFTAFALIRTAWGRAIPINSGFRCQVHNRAIGGEPLSAHLFGLALDLAVAGPHELVDLKNICVSIWPKLRIGWKRYLNAGQNLIHIDTAYLINVRPTAAFIEGMRW
jgi:uncharacterized protein YcbK (DUF882 family)